MSFFKSTTKANLKDPNESWALICAGGAWLFGQYVVSDKKLFRPYTHAFQVMQVPGQPGSVSKQRTLLPFQGVNSVKSIKVSNVSVTMYLGELDDEDIDDFYDSLQMAERFREASQKPIVGSPRILLPGVGGRVQ